MERKLFGNLSLSFQGVPEDLSTYAFFKAIREGFGSSEFIQFREGNEWLKLWEEKLNKKRTLKLSRGVILLI